MLPIALVCPFLIARTNQSNWQHREKTKGAIKNGQTRATGNTERKPKGQSKMDKQEQLATSRENQRGNEKWTNKTIALASPFLIAPLVFSLCCQLLWFVHF
jgi:hypothetical protein